MVEWLSTLLGLGKSFSSEATRAYKDHELHKRDLLHDFILEAIGQRECLRLDSHESGTISFDTIELRVRLLQESEPNRASRAGVPGVNDMNRSSRLKELLQEMVRLGKLKRCHQADRWKIV